MKRDGDMHMRGGRIKERSRGTQQKKKEEKNRRAGIEKERHWGEKSHFMKMRFSTECDYNDHQRETVAECEQAACARFRVHISSFWPTFSRIYVHYSRFMGSFLALFAAQPSYLYAAHVTLRTCPRAYAWVWSLNLLLLCSVECIYMKRRLTFPFRLKPWRPDILLTVAADILPLFPQEDYITPLLSPLISLSNILFLPPLLCSTPFAPL